MKYRMVVPVLAAGALVVHTGCATKKYVRTETTSVEESMREQITAIETQIEDAQDRLEGHDETLTQQGVKLAKTSETAQDALVRAQEAGKLAEGKLLYEVVLSSDDVTFGFDEVQLADDTKAALDAFAGDLKEANQNVFIEIQGHTDTTGPEDYNLMLGEKRAEAVRRYLSMEHDIPLHRMSVISYGENAPLVEGNDRESRARNRRVNLVVLM